MVLYTTLSPKELANIVAHYEIGTPLIPFLNDRLSLAKTRLSSRNSLRLLHACLNVNLKIL